MLYILLVAGTDLNANNESVTVSLIWSPLYPSIDVNLIYKLKSGL